jgi:hypothetical protein
MIIPKTLCCALILCISQICYSQDAESIAADFKFIATNVPSALGSEDQCSTLLRNNESIQEQVDKSLEKGGLSSNDRSLLNWVKTHSKALDRFMRTVGQSGYMANYLKDSELSLVKDLFNVEFVEVFKEKNFCCKLYECKMGGYTCLLAYKPGKNEIYTVKASLLVQNGSNTTTMGLSTNQYRRIWSTAVPKSYKVTFVSCEYTGSSTFDF